MKVYVMVSEGTRKIETEISENSMYVFKSKRAAKQSREDAGGENFYDIREAELKIGRKI